MKETNTTSENPMIFAQVENINDTLITQGIDPKTLESIDKKTLQLITSITAKICYATKNIFLKDIIDLPIKKLESLLSPNASIAYYEGIEAAKLIPYEPQEINLLVSFAARTAYKAGFIDIDTLSIKPLEEKLTLLLQCCISHYCDTEMDKTEKLTQEAIELLISDQAVCLYENKKCSPIEFLDFDLSQIQSTLDLLGDNSVL